MSRTFLSHEEQADLWARVSAGDKSAQEELLLAYQPLAGAIAKKQVIPSHVDREDILSYAMIGLYQAIVRFDPSTSDGNYAKHFASFAKMRISGSILDYIKSKEVSWAPRAVFRSMKERYAIEGRLQQVLGREPTEAETAEAMGVAIADLPRLSIQVPMTSAQSSEEGSGLDSIASDEDVSSDAGLSILSERFARAIESLPESSRNVLSVYVTKQVPRLRRLPDGFSAQDFDSAFLALRLALKDESIV